MKILANEKQCIGCGLCAHICEKNAISMQPKVGGFLYPEIDEGNCISCNRCKSICPVLKEKNPVNPKNCYALVDNRTDKRIKSASGGASALFFEQVINSGGAICGCRLDENLKAVHDTTDKIESIDLFRDSKYVQSDMSSVWEKINSYIKQGKKLLVAGTPCQIAAVNSRFGKNDSLITVDFVCSGVPDPSIFEIYKNTLEKESDKKVKEFYFRDKTNGWKKSNIRVVYSDETQQIITRKDSFYFKLFGGNMYFRECCYNCRFKNFNTCADITIGDYWGIEKRYPDLDDDKGCSLVIVNTDKGRQLLSEVENVCTLVETPLEFAIETHPKIKNSIARNKYKDLFYAVYNNDEASFRRAYKLCTDKSMIIKAVRVLINKFKLYKI